MSFLHKKFESITASRKISLGIIILLTLLVFFNIFQNNFILHDYENIEEWYIIQDLRNLPQFFNPPGDAGLSWATYSPLKTTFHSFIFNIGEFNAHAYHGIALILHVLITILVYHLSFALTKKPSVAFISGLFFGLTPVHTESVTSMTTSLDLLGLLFFFAAFMFYVRARDPEGRSPKVFYGLSVFSSFLALFTFEQALSLPFLFVLYECCLKNESIKNRPLWMRVLPFFVLDIFYFLVKELLLGYFALYGYLDGSFYLTMLVVIKSLAKYAMIMAWPAVLTLNHMISKGIYSYEISGADQRALFYQSILDVQVLGSFALVAGLIWLAVKYKKRHPVLSFGIGWFFLSLLPASNLIPSSVVLSEKFLYPASFGFCLLAAYLLMKIYDTENTVFKKYARWMALLVIGVVTFFYAQRTVARNADWRNSLVFYAAEAETNPESALSQASLGVTYMQHGNYPDAIALLEKAIKIKPDNPNYYFALADAHTELEEHRKAIEYLEQIIRMDPTYVEAYYNAAVSYAALDQFGVADSFLRKAVKLYEEAGRHEEAQEILRMFFEFFNKKSHQIRRDIFQETK